MMIRLLLMTVATAALTYPTGRLEAQEHEAGAPAGFEAISESVIRIRTIADLEYEQADRTGSARKAVRPYSVDGTGVVVGEIEVEGNTEYLILTNHHVADASNYVLQEAGYLRVNPANTRAVPSVDETSYLMETAGGEVASEGIELIEVVRLVRGDMTLMRTSGASRALAVFEGRIGFVDGEVSAGAPVVTSGYPWGGEKITASGSIVEVDHPHELGLPHADFVVDLPVEPGQSGGPIFLVEPDAGESEAARFRLIGLVHAKDRDRNYGVPYTLWRDSLDEFPAVLQARLVR